MRNWFNWRTVVGSIPIAIVFASILFVVEGRSFSLSGLDLFFAVTTLISLGFNLWQVFRDRYKHAPVKDALIGIVNDLKARGLRGYQRRILIESPAGMALSLEAVRLEFYDFAGESIQSFDQLREHVVAAIHILDPDASTQQVFRAAEFGLNEQERRIRREGLERLIEQSRRGSASNLSQRQAQTEQAAEPTEEPGDGESAITTPAPED